MSLWFSSSVTEPRLQRFESVMSDDSKFKPGPTEAECYCRLEFSVKKPNGTSTIHYAELSLDVQISGLKDDMSSMVGGSWDTQEWKYGGTVLENDKCLRDYGITGDPKHGRKPIIAVKVHDS